jgi:hypothetical protein
LYIVPLPFWRVSTQVPSKCFKHMEGLLVISTVIENCRDPSKKYQHRYKGKFSGYPENTSSHGVWCYIGIESSGTKLVLCCSTSSKKAVRHLFIGQTMVQPELGMIHQPHQHKKKCYSQSSLRWKL